MFIHIISIHFFIRFEGKNKQNNIFLHENVFSQPAVHPFKRIFKMLRFRNIAFGQIYRRLRIKGRILRWSRGSRAQPDSKYQPTEKGKKKWKQIQSYSFLYIYFQKFISVFVKSLQNNFRYLFDMAIWIRSAVQMQLIGCPPPVHAFLKK